MIDLPVPFLRELEEQAAAYLAESDPIRQSGFGGGRVRWRAEREAILEGVNGSGSFVDLGCANGYLLECLQTWGHERGVSLSPFGIDHSADLVALARHRFSGLETHFTAANAWSWRPPAPIRFVYTLHDAVPPAYLGDYLNRLLREVVAPAGRLIVGAYGSRSRGLPPFDVAGLMRTLQMPVVGRTDRRRSTDYELRLGRATRGPCCESLRSHLPSRAEDEGFAWRSECGTAWRSRTHARFDGVSCRWSKALCVEPGSWRVITSLTLERERAPWQSGQLRSSAQPGL